MPVVKIDVEMCKGCDLCIAFCPFQSLEKARNFNSHGLHPVALKDEYECNGCRNCAIICPDAAIEVYV